MDFSAFKRELVAHYVRLARTPGGWKAQARHSANDLAKRFPNEFGDLPELVRAELANDEDDEHCVRERPHDGQA